MSPLLFSMESGSGMQQHETAECRELRHGVFHQSCGSVFPNRIYPAVQLCSPLTDPAVSYVGICADQLFCIDRLLIGASSSGHYHSVQPPLVSLCAGVFTRALSLQETALRQWGSVAIHLTWWHLSACHFIMIPLRFNWLLWHKRSDINNGILIVYDVSINHTYLRYIFCLLWE